VVAGLLCVQAVTLDLWETLLFEKEGYDERRCQIRCRNLGIALAEYGVSATPEELSDVLAAMGPWLHEIWDRDEDIAHMDQVRFVARTLSAGSSDSLEMAEGWLESLSKAYASAVYELPPYLNPDAPGLLAWLSNQGIRIGLISNVGRTPGFALRELLEIEGIAEYFDVMVFSDEVRIRKPDPEIFHRAVRELGAESGGVVHVGDSLRSDIWGAKKAGMKAIHLCSIGRDALAEADPTSQASLEGRWERSDPGAIAPDMTIASLAQAPEALVQLRMS
jgi:putative hydrolase of the HAD superfamily